MENLEYINNPLVTIGLMVYNGERYLRETLSCLLLQDYVNLEIILADNASTDGTQEICQEFAERTSHIRYIRHPRNVGSETQKCVLPLVRGKYYMPAADHDLWHPTYIRRCVEVLESYPEVALCYARTARIDLQGKPVGMAHNQFDTRGMSPAAALKYFIWNIWGAGDLNYGVFRFQYLKNIISTPVWAVDQANLAQICLQGAIAHVPDILFFWRVTADESMEHRRKVAPKIIDPQNKYKMQGMTLPELWGLHKKELLAIVNRSNLTSDEKEFLYREIEDCFLTRYGVPCSAAFSNICSPQGTSRSAPPQPSPRSPSPGAAPEKRKRILLATSAAPSQSPFSTVEKRPPLGLGFIIAVLRNAGHEVHFIDNYLQESDFLASDEFKKHRFDFVGIYANTICYRSTLRMLHQLHYLRLSGQWSGKILVGGPHTTVAPESIPSFVDHIVQGEGEDAILDIVEGRVSQRIVRYPRIKDLDRLPMPAWDVFVGHPYDWSCQWFPGRPVFTLNTSRGCPFRCSFCSVGSIWGRKYSYFSAKRVVSEIEHLIQRYGAEGFYFREDNFTINRRRVVEFCELLINKQIKIPWVCETRVNSLDRELVQLMANAGAQGFYFGVESGSQRMLDFLKKDITVEQIRNAFALCHEFNIKCAASLVVGIPSETQEDLLSTRDLLQEIKPTIVWTNVFVGIPNSYLYKYVLDNKLYEVVDDRGLLYLKGHDARADFYYDKSFNAKIPFKLSSGKIADPQISIVMSVYNGSKFLKEAIRSILNQTYQDFEFIIVNDASTDESRSILSSFRDPRIIVLENERNLGLTASLNKAIRSARGRYIARMDADDISLPHRLEEQMTFLTKNPHCSLVGSAFYEIDEKGSILNLKTHPTDDASIRSAITQYNCFGHGTVMMTRAALMDVGGYDESFNAAQDYDLWLRMSEKHELANLKEPLYCWRFHGSSVSCARQFEQRHFADLALSKLRQRTIGRKQDPTLHAPQFRTQATQLRSCGNDLSLSFCIITSGQRRQLLDLVLASIQAQKIPCYEIIITGDYESRNDIAYIPAPEAAQNGKLSILRNLGVQRAQYGNIVILDDDIILDRHWYVHFAAYASQHPFDIVTSQVRSPDGSRFWDHAVLSGPKGQIILDPNEEGDDLYMTGGGGWIMRSHVARAIKWDESLGFYDNEDGEFSRCCRAHNFRISHNHDAIVYHADDSYTTIGRKVFRRKERMSQGWVHHALSTLPAQEIVKTVQSYLQERDIAAAGDCIRYFMVTHPEYPLVNSLWKEVVDIFGGELADSRWHWEGDPQYLETIRYYENQIATGSIRSKVPVVPSNEWGIKWGSHVLGFSGHAAHARLCLRSLDKHGVPLAMEPFAHDEKFLAQQPPEEVDRWQRLLKADVRGGAYICFAVPFTLQGTDIFQACRSTNPSFDIFVGAATFETDRLPPGWAGALSRVDEVWVPSTFNQATFGHAGVDPGRIQVFPTGIDTDLFAPERVKPLAIPDRRAFTFLSVFQWTKRKGWDILLKAFLDAFDRHDDVCLVLRAYPLRSRHVSLRQTIEDYLNRCGRSPHEAPPIILLDQFLPEADMPSLYAAADAFVLPTRGEGFGLPFLEAMATGLPTLGTGWGGHLDFMNDDNSYLLDVDGLAAIPADQTHESPFYTPDQRWAEPSVQHTAETMRAVFDHREAARAKGMKARSDVKRHWSEERCARWITERVDMLLAPRGKKIFALRDQSSAQYPSDAPADSHAPVTQPPSVKPPLLWTTPLFDPSGYADEARHLILSAAPRWTIKIRPAGRSSEEFANSLPPAERKLFQQMLETHLGSPYIHIMQTPAKGFFRDPGAMFNVGRTVFETDRLPDNWADRCNRMDEIWVPTPFNMETFERAGVRVPIHVVPQGVDGHFFHPGAQPILLPQCRGFVFLSVFEWVYRKGWDVLLRSWAETFSPEEDVCLVLRTYCFNAVDHEQNETTINTRIDEFLRDRLGRSRKDVAPIIVLAGQVPQHAMAGLYTAADAFVLPSRGEGWGRPYIEAMACGLPVIGTRWSGNLTFMNNENSFLIDTNGLEEVGSEMEFDDYRGHRWSVPSGEHLRNLLRQVFEDREEAKRKGEAARRDVTTLWTWEKAGAILSERLTTIVEQIASSNATRDKGAASFKSPAPFPLRLVWEGAQLAHHSLALVNREICGQLLSRTGIELSLIPLPPQELHPTLDPSYERLVGKMNTPLSGPPAVHVRHYWPPDFTPPPSGHWVMIQPWEYGRLPEEWIEPMTHLVDEIWVPSRHVLKTYLASGIPADRVAVIPNGVNTAAFHPDAMPLPLSTSKTFRFLFVGGTIWRKGIDLLLDAYARAFRRQDDVVLVIKDMGQDSFYRNQGAGSAIQQLQNDPEAPEILYLTDILNEQQMPGLFTACSCLAHPYRGEGFGLPVLEAMACGMPVMVTAGGATDDFCSSDSAYLVPSRIRGVACAETQLVGGVGWVQEPDVEELVKIMHHVYEHPDEARQKAQRALTRARSEYPWEKIVDLVVRRMRSLAAKPIRRLRPA